MHHPGANLEQLYLTRNLGRGNITVSVDQQVNELFTFSQNKCSKSTLLKIISHRSSSLQWNWTNKSAERRDKWLDKEKYKQKKRRNYRYRMCQVKWETIENINPVWQPLSHTEYQKQLNLPVNILNQKLADTLHLKEQKVNYYNYVPEPL